MDIYITLIEGLEEQICNADNCTEWATFGFVCDTDKYDGEFCNQHAIELYREARERGYDSWHEPLDEDKTTEDILESLDP